MNKSNSRPTQAWVLQAQLGKPGYLCSSMIERVTGRTGVRERSVEGMGVELVGE